MRFCVPKSRSPSIEKEKQSGNRFRAPTTYDSDSTDYDDDLSSNEGDESFDTNISVASVDDAVSEGEADLLCEWDKLKISNRSPEEERVFTDAIASVRSHSRYVDPYEQWQMETRRSAFHAARRQHTGTSERLQESQIQLHLEQQKRIDAARVHEGEQFRVVVDRYRTNTTLVERQLHERWKERDRQLWERIEASINEEEVKANAAREAERKRQEAEDNERRQREEEARKEADAAQKAKEEAERAKEEKRKQEVAEKIKKEIEEMEHMEREKELRDKKVHEEGSSALRDSTEMVDCETLWKQGLKGLQLLKSTVMVAVKGPRPPDPEPAGYQAPPAPPLKKLWNAQRRKITPKIGQLTDDEGEISRITEEIKAIVAIPNMPNELDARAIHYALLLSFAKAIIAQAETEVTAHKAQVRPLARVAIALMITYPDLGDIFWVRFIARAGCWIAGIEPSLLEGEQSASLSDKEKRKRWGARADEGLEEKMMRLSGVLRLYFHMLFVSTSMAVNEPMPLAFRPGRYWLYMAQLLNNAPMLGRSVSAEIIYVGLEEGGVHARSIWGKQYIKMLQLIYECLRSEEHKTKIGGTEVLAQASRARCLLEIEKIMSQP